MAEWTFSLASLPTRDQMPPVCARCGRAAFGTRKVRLAVAEPYSGPDPLATLAGVSNDAQRRWHDFREMLARGKGVLELPVCWWHRWIVPPLLGVQSMTESRVTLWGIADSFVKQMKQRKS